jgi:hypothetical protein
MEVLDCLKDYPQHIDLSIIKKEEGFVVQGIDEKGNVTEYCLAKSVKFEDAVKQNF